MDTDGENGVKCPNCGATLTKDEELSGEFRLHDVYVHPEPPSNEAEKNCILRQESYFKRRPQT